MIVARCTSARACLAAPDRRAVCRATGSARAAAQDVGTDAQRESGKKLYHKILLAVPRRKRRRRRLRDAASAPEARNFTSGKFKVRTTPNGALPTHQDLVNIIRRGMPYTSMPAWPTLTDQEVSDLAHFVKTFSPDFASNGQRPAADRRFRARRRSTKESIEAGKKLYEETGCVKCHGTVGRGDGPSAPA